MFIVTLLWVILGLAVVIVTLVWPNSWKVLGPKDQAIKLRFGQPTGEIRHAGIVHKYPWERLGVMDGRDIVVDLSLGQLSTGAPDPMQFGLDMAIVMRPVDPMKYLLKLKGEPATILIPFVRGAMQRRLNEMSSNVLLDGSLAQLLTEIAQYVQQMGDEWGVEVIRVTLEDLDLPQVIIETTEIRQRAQAQADAKRDTSAAEVETTLKEIAAEGEYYALHQLLDTIEASAPHGFGHVLSVGSELVSLMGMVGSVAAENGKKDKGGSAAK